ncbi:hypothetical protein [Loigolactobacillus binensis]|uniref:Uncharacterized protein n=1 Tax=Loigolactobacillus binensis TaxID=2559922 RepID=A0ABW3EAH9_9LACO|nr:hypothetical protein [Loigolactobacillus binensis]
MTVKAENKRVKYTMTPESLQELAYIVSVTHERPSELIRRVLHADYELTRAGFNEYRKKQGDD